jgi:hypothetical protein
MWRMLASLRALVSALVAVTFIVAVIPGAMAMPAPQRAAHHAMDCMAKAAPHCDHMKPVKEQGSPCKNMQACMGMLGCFGMAAVAYEASTPSIAFVATRVADLHQAVTGLVPPPDDRPPIA